MSIFFSTRTKSSEAGRKSECFFVNNLLTLAEFFIQKPAFDWTREFITYSFSWSVQNVSRLNLRLMRSNAIRYRGPSSLARLMQSKETKGSSGIQPLKSEATKVRKKQRTQNASPCGRAACAASKTFGKNSFTERLLQRAGHKESRMHGGGQETARRRSNRQRRFRNFGEWSLPMMKETAVGDKFE